jgi:hypothetical protein
VGPPDEELGTHLALEPRQTTAERGLGDVEHGGRGGEGAVPLQGVDELEIGTVHLPHIPERHDGCAISVLDSMAWPADHAPMDPQLVLLTLGIVVVGFGSGVLSGDVRRRRR